jgi:hypothetical protein
VSFSLANDKSEKIESIYVTKKKLN